MRKVGDKQSNANAPVKSLPVDAGFRSLLPS